MRISDWSSDVCSSDLAFKMGAGTAIKGRPQQDTRRHGKQDCSHGLGDVAKRRKLQNGVTVRAAGRNMIRGYKCEVKTGRCNATARRITSSQAQRTPKPLTSTGTEPPGHQSTHGA